VNPRLLGVHRRKRGAHARGRELATIGERATGDVRVAPWVDIGYCCETMAQRQVRYGPMSWSVRGVRARLRPPGPAPLLLALASVYPQLGCQPRLDAGQWACTSAPFVTPDPDSGVFGGEAMNVASGWETGFEDGFCGFQRARGFCYTAADGAYRLVESPARGGRFAAAFTVTTNAEQDGSQARCVREGALPKDAYYGAWFFIPGGTTSDGNWNLMHLQGNNLEGGGLHGLWDVSIESGPNGELFPRLIGFLNDELLVLEPDSPTELPPDEWFELVFHLDRDAGSAGSVALYLNGRQLLQRTGITTDDSSWGQWYVGNLATVLTPSESTVYVDDVSIQETRQIPP
jgi:hypothetical protein